PRVAQPPGENTSASSGAGRTGWRKTGQVFCGIRARTGNLVGKPARGGRVSGQLGARPRRKRLEVVLARALHRNRSIVAIRSPACPTTRRRASFRYARPGTMRTHAAPARARALGLFATMLGLVLPASARSEDGGRSASVALAVDVGFDGP